MTALEIATSALALLLLYVLAVAGTVGAGAIYCAWAARRYAALALPPGPAPEQPERFAPRPRSPFARLRGFAFETGCQLLAFTLRGAHDLRLLRAARGDARCTPVLVVPGFVENAGTMWWLGRRLARAGFNVIALEFPSTTCALEQNVAYLAAAIEKVRAAHDGQTVAVVAHSMGGVITRAHLLGREDHGVRTLVAIGSPFQGTHLARVGARLNIGHCVGQMTPGSEFNRRFPPSTPCPVPTFSLIAPQENIVTPVWSAEVAGARLHVLAEAYGHTAPLFMRGVAHEVADWLRAHGVTCGAPQQR